MGDQEERRHFFIITLAFTLDQRSLMRTSGRVAVLPCFFVFFIVIILPQQFVQYRIFFRCACGFGLDARRWSSLNILNTPEVI